MSHSGNIWAIGIVFLIVVIVLAYVLEKIDKWRRKNAAHHPTSPNAETDPTLVPTSAQPPAPAPKVIFPIRNSPERVRDFLRKRKAVNASLDETVVAATAEFGDWVTVNEIFEAATRAGFPLPDITSSMTAHGYTVQEIASSLAEWTDNLDAKQLGSLIAPFVNGETEAMRIEHIFIIVRDTLFPNSHDDDDLLQLPQEFGCSCEEAAAILYRNTDFRLGSILTALTLCESPDVIARIAHDLHIDFALDEDEYADLRNDWNDERISFPKIVAILKACGCGVEAIATAEGRENDYGGFSEDTDEIFAAFSNAGFTNADIMSGLKRSEAIGENANAEIVEAACARNISLQEIGAFLSREHVDPDDLDAEMRDINIDLRTRVDVLYALFHP